MSINQKYFYFRAIEYTVVHKKTIFVFSDFSALLFFIVESKIGKGKFDENSIKLHFK